MITSFFQTTNQFEAGNIYRGIDFQRGYEIGFVRPQYGRGIGNILSVLWRTLLPTLRSVGAAIGREAFSTGGRILENSAQEGNIGRTIKNETPKGVRNLAKKVIEQEG